MMLVVDANILSPEFIIEEFFKYESLILKKTSRTREQFIQIMHMLKEVITVVPEEEYSAFMKEAKSISPDEKDTMYFALALKLKCGIWSNDKKLKEQNRVAVYSTNEVIKMI